MHRDLAEALPWHDQANMLLTFLNELECSFCILDLKREMDWHARQLLKCVVSSIIDIHH